MTIICYYDQDGKAAWKGIPGSVETALAAWRAEQPSIQPTFVFKTTDNVSADDGDARIAFEAACGRYGLEPSDFDRPILMENDRRGYIRGFQPKRRKYVVKIWDCSKQDYVLATPEYTLRAAERYDLAKQQANS